jgi:hypothetical protein
MLILFQLNEFIYRISEFVSTLRFDAAKLDTIKQMLNAQMRHVKG